MVGVLSEMPFRVDNQWPRMDHNMRPLVRLFPLYLSHRALFLLSRYRSRSGCGINGAKRKPLCVVTFRKNERRCGVRVLRVFPLCRSSLGNMHVLEVFFCVEMKWLFVFVGVCWFWDDNRKVCVKPLIDWIEEDDDDFICWQLGLMTDL